VLVFFFPMDFIDSALMLHDPVIRALKDCQLTTKGYGSRKKRLTIHSKRLTGCYEIKFR